MQQEPSNSLEQEETAQILKEIADNGSFAEYCIAIDDQYQLEWFHEEVARKLENGYQRLMKGEDVRIMFFMPPRHGKEIAHSTAVMTTEGWSTHGSLKVGDYVYHPSGHPIKVLALAQKENQDDYVVEFSNGEQIRCHANHEWTVYDRSIGRLVTYPTSYFVGKTKFGKIKQVISNNRSIYQLPPAWGIEYRKAKLPLHPYYLGAWLGDGTAGDTSIVASASDLEPIKKLAELGYTPSYEYTHKTTGVIKYGFGHQGVAKSLRQLGCLKEKTIPEVYLRSSKQQRLELLAGLVDTDGHVERSTGRVRIATASTKLKDSIVDLVTTLGFRPYVTVQKPTLSTSGIQGRRDVYYVGFQPTEDIPTAIPRKRVKRFAAQRAIGFKRVMYQPNGERGRCIQVDSPDGLYLVGKSMIPTHNSDMTTQKFPSWLLGKHPEMPIMISSYSDELATDFGQKTRDIMQTPEYKAMFNTRLRADAKARGKWLTEEGGGYTAVGVGGALTGRGFKIGIIDDPFKNREEADSPVIRESRYKWYQSTFSTREEGNSMVIFILTRWHEDDLAGRVLKENQLAIRAGEPHTNWEIIEYKAIATQDEEHRKEGEALWPDKFNLGKLLKKKTEMGPYEFSSLYQQNPVDDENRKFKSDWIQYREFSEVQKMNTYNVMTIDPRGKDDIKLGRDYVGITINFVDSEGNWNIISYREKLSAKQFLDLLFTNWEKYNLDRIGIEDNQFYQGMKYLIEEECRRRNVHPYILELKTGGTQKELRIEGLVPRYNNLTVYHVTMNGQNLCADLEEELATFPKASNDDASDSLAYQNQIAMTPGGHSKDYVSRSPESQQPNNTPLAIGGIEVGQDINAVLNRGNDQNGWL